MKDLVYKLSKFVRMYPKPFVKASSILVMLSGFTGTLLDLAMPVPAFILVLGLGLWTFQEKIADKIRHNPLGEMFEQMEKITEEVKK